MRTLSRDEMEYEILDEGRQDWISFPFITQCVRVYEGADQGEPSLSKRALEVAVALVHSERLVAGDLTRDGFFPWEGDSTAVTARLRRDSTDILAQHGYIPLGEVCWFATLEMLATQTSGARGGGDARGA